MTGDASGQRISACRRMAHNNKQREAVPVKHTARYYMVVLSLLLLLGIRAGEAEAQIILNGDFESGTLDNWSANNWGSSGNISASVESVSPIEGAYSAKVSITGADDPFSNEWYYLNLQQTFAVTANRTYHAVYKIRASEICHAVVITNQNGSPYEGIGYTEVPLGPEVQELRVSGTCGFTDQAHILFQFGKTKRGVDVWIDAVSMTERLPEPTSATVTVDFSNPDTDASDLTGILLGLDINNLLIPDASLITPLQPKYWRVRPNSSYIGKVEGYGATAVALLSEGFYPGTNPPGKNPPWDDNYAAWEAHCTAVAQENGTDVIYDIWNEPDHPVFFRYWSDGDWPHFLETFKKAHDAVRAVVPDAVICGPSTSAAFPEPLLKDFMDYCVANNLQVDILATHMFHDTDVSFDDMREDLLELRAEYIDAPAYASVGATRFFATEYANPNLVARPGSILAMLRFMEEGLVDGAIRSTWDTLDPGSNTAFDGSLGGLITSDKSSRRAIWWAMEWYADGAGERVHATSSNPEIVPLACLEYEQPLNSQILLASRAYGGPAQDMTTVTLVLDNLAASRIVGSQDTEVEVWVHIAPNASGSAAYDTPTLVANQTLPIVDDAATLTLTNPMQAYDALEIRFSQSDLPPLESASVERWFFYN